MCVSAAWRRVGNLSARVNIFAVSKDNAAYVNYVQRLIITYDAFSVASENVQLSLVYGYDSLTLGARKGVVS